MTLALPNAHSILQTLMSTTRDRSKCDVCAADLGVRSYLICKDKDVGEEHVGHTACAECAESRAYFGNRGACAVCMRIVRGGAVGLALNPPIVNGSTNKLLEGFSTAGDEIDRQASVAEDERIADNARRRASAVQEVRQKRLLLEEREEELCALQERAAEIVRRRDSLQQEETRMRINQRFLAKPPATATVKPKGPPKAKPYPPKAKPKGIDKKKVMSDNVRITRECDALQAHNATLTRRCLNMEECLHAVDRVGSADVRAIIARYAEKDV